MSFSRWQTESDTRIAKVVVSLPASVAVYRAASVFWLKIGPLQEVQTIMRALRPWTYAPGSILIRAGKNRPQSRY